MSDVSDTKVKQPLHAKPVVKPPLDRRIAELRDRAPVYISHGDALLLIGNASASLREQRLTDQQIELD